MISLGANPLHEVANYTGRVRLRASALDELCVITLAKVVKCWRDKLRISLWVS
jgi:hypothetical protein